MKALKRGAVVEYPALFAFESYPRPYLIVSTDGHPFFGDEYIGLAVTTTDLDAAVGIPDDAWVSGGLPRESFVKPWQPVLLKHDDVIDAFGLLRPALVDRVAEELAALVGVARG